LSVSKQDCDEGRKIAEEFRYRCTTTLAFLVKPGVSPEVAEVDAEGMEHHGSKETLRAFEKFINGR